MLFFNAGIPPKRKPYPRPLATMPLYGLGCVVNHASVLPLRHVHEPPADLSGLKNHSPWGEKAWSPKCGLVPANPVYNRPLLRSTQMPPALKLGAPEGFGLEIKVTESFVQSFPRSTDINVFAGDASVRRGGAVVLLVGIRVPHLQYSYEMALAVS